MTKPARIPSLAAVLATAVGFCLLSSPAASADFDAEWTPPRLVQEMVDGSLVSADGAHVFADWQEYIASDYFQSQGGRCLTPFLETTPEEGDNPADCTYNLTNPLASYEPTVLYRIPVVVHIIMSTSGTGAISDATVASQIQVLNEDYQAIAGSLGAPGYNVEFEFFLATEDPAGDPTTGITRSTNNSWFNDSGSYWNSLAWDPDRYLNIYTNQASGALGYVPGLPQQGIVGALSDRVVIYYRAFGLTSFTPYHLGRTVTHEVGHYLGLFHTFQGSCSTPTPPGCYSTGDRICDTNSEANPQGSCPSSFTSCSSLDPIHNYMDYSYDICMNQFTHEQARRMRCTIEGYRPDLYQVAATDVSFPVVTTHGTSLTMRAGVPNPFTPQTTLRYALPSEAPVSLVVYDELGRRVRSLVEGVQPAGNHEATWRGDREDGRPAAPGVYFLRLEAGGESTSQKVVLQR